MPHTPGPWKAERHDAAGSIIIDGAGPHNVGIATVNRYERHDVEANARLIAAAPDLLAACEYALAWMEARECHSEDSYALRETIAKARGIGPAKLEADLIAKRPDRPRPIGGIPGFSND